MNDVYDSESNWVLRLILIILGIIIVFNIGFIKWQISLEKKYGVLYDEVEIITNEYREYYSIEEAIDSYCIQLNEIKGSAKNYVTQNIIALIVEVSLGIVTFVPSFLINKLFGINKVILKFHSNRTTNIILLIEIIISLLTCFMNIKESVEMIVQYQRIYRLLEDIFKGLVPILDTINYQINQYR